jgi:hypothetical protein
MSSIAPQSNLTAAVRQRDITCRVTAFESGTEVAHLIPEHERQWFLSNSMDVWNTDLTLDPENLLRDLSNAVLLRSDIHTAFDQRKSSSSRRTLIGLSYICWNQHQTLDSYTIIPASTSPSAVWSSCLRGSHGLYFLRSLDFSADQPRTDWSSD